jgi:S-adenosylmethionine decarboxylase
MCARTRKSRPRAAFPVDRIGEPETVCQNLARSIGAPLDAEKGAGLGMEQQKATGEPALPFFEGTEKKVELVVGPGAPPLRGMGEEYWSAVAVRAGARVLSRLSNGHCDAYLLSESSLFVYDHKMIMITCGQTRLPEAVLEVLRKVPADDVRFFIYERKNEVFPHIQPTSFFDDIRTLNAALPGRAYQFGDEDDHHLYLFHLDRPFDDDPQDMTTEILMYGIDERVGRALQPGAGAGSMRERTGVAGILPGFELDDHRFEPTGYSLNAIRDDEYWTLHVTPEPISSYASFETNRRLGNGLGEVAERVLDVFRPRSFDIVLFDRNGIVPFESERYQLKAHVAQELSCGYKVRFLSYFRPRTGIRQPLEIPVA